VGEHLTLTGGRGGDDREAGVEILEYFIGDREIAAGGLMGFECEADIVLGDKSWEGVWGYERGDLQSRAVGEGKALAPSGGEALVIFAKESELAGLLAG
jgi:hypothetical protein